MLAKLHIENIALITRLDLQLGRGLNVLTGETGAGKSIVIDAVNLIMGGRASTELIRSGHEKALVEALFDTDGLEEVWGKLRSLGLTPEEDGTLLLARELTSNGKHSCRINGRSVTLSMLREVGQYLVDIYGQHDHQALLNPARHLFLLDQFGDRDFQQKMEQFATCYHSWRQTRKSIDELQSRERERARQLDLLKYQQEEIDQAGLRAGEEEELLRTARLLNGGEKLVKLTAHAYVGLQGGNKQPGVLEVLSQVVSQMKEIAAIDESRRPLMENLEGAYYQLEEGAGELRHYQEGLEFDPNRLAEIEDRLDLIKKLKRKYGDSVEQVLAYGAQVTSELEQLENAAEKLEALEEQAVALRKQGEALASQITGSREQLGQQLQCSIQQELEGLMMPQVKFEVCLTPLAEWQADGADQVEFLISPNPGEPLKSLAKIASGGEMSRIMLALKTILAKVDQLPTLIFDEVDAGIGGRAAQAVGEKLSLIGEDRQVICVTHSPQVSSFARHHFYISKNNEEGRTITRIMELDSQGRVEELARMLGGQEITGTTRKHAKEMLTMARKD